MKFFVTLRLNSMKKEDLQYNVIMGALKTFALLPLGVLYGLSDMAAFVLHRCVKYRRAVIRKNLHAAFPEKSEKEIRRIERGFYRHLTDVSVETLKMLHISDRQVRRRVRLSNEHLVAEALQGGHPIILYLGHFGNWEWVPAMTMMLSEPKKMGALYLPQREALMDRIIVKIRSRFNLLCIPKDTAFRRMVELRRESPSFMIGFIGDQRPMGKNNLRHWIRFLNQPTAILVGGETIGDKINARYLYVEARTLKRGHYELHFEKIAPDREAGGEFAVTKEYFRLLENSIRREPSNWLWSHNRWVATPPEDWENSTRSLPENLAK